MSSWLSEATRSNTPIGSTFGAVMNLLIGFVAGATPAFGLLVALYLIVEEGFMPTYGEYVSRKGWRDEVRVEGLIWGRGLKNSLTSPNPAKFGAAWSSFIFNLIPFALIVLGAFGWIAFKIASLVLQAIGLI